MRFVIQRTTGAQVSVDGEVTGRVGKGLVVLIGVSATDTEEIADRMTDKMLKLRIFEDENGKTNLDLAKVGGGLLLISQFTLYADCRHGNRPGFTNAGGPELANALYERIIARCRETVPEVGRGVFGAEMKVELVNDGPFTVILDSEEILK
ncbi:MAG: D-tyrosyl-tRNA(Tyr) deacylase [Firmicutes bacterium]|nr:D-tyrosyl-tRNA(Tyr) deacylase [Bacillota bacterium]MBQ6662588.1 D-tyrosyl-tRNA(Tyr) deacylase [Bacillota bacterium]MCR4711171.1 D-tyrosyl-tRNA(Tyr) deacylase [Clostridia bacterium]